MAAPSSRHIEPLLPTVQSVTGAAALTGTGSSTVAGTHAAIGAAALTGLGSMTVAGVRLRFGAAALTGLGSMTVAGSRVSYGAAALTGTGTMTVAGTRTRTGAAALTGLGSSTVAGTHAAIGAAALTGNGTLTTNGTRVRFGSSSLTGTGTLTCAGTVSRSGAAALTGLGSLNAAGSVSYTGSAHLTGTGTLTATPAGLDTDAGPPLFVAQARRPGKHVEPKHVRASARLTGLGHLEALGMLVREPGAASFAGEADLSGTFTVTASGVVGATHTGAAAVRFTTQRSLTATVDMSLASVFVTATGSQRARGEADLIGFGYLRAFGFTQPGGLTDRQRDEELLALLL